MEEAMILAEKIADKPPLAIRMMKRAIYQAQTSTLKAHLDYISSQLAFYQKLRITWRPLALSLKKKADLYRKVKKKLAR